MQNILENIGINENSTISEAFWKYNHNNKKLLIVLDDDNNFKGIITHREIYQTKLNPEDKVSSIVNTNCKRVQYSDNKEIMHNSLKEIFTKFANINCVPIIEENKVIDLFAREKFMDLYPELNIKEQNSEQLKGNYSPIIKNIVNEYLSANYNLNINTLEEVVEKYLVPCKIIKETKLDNIPFRFEDSVISCVVSSVSGEINFSDEYNFREMNFKEGDVVVDIGGNIGMVSIYLAKLFPFLKIYAYEPILQNYKSFLHNIELNNIPAGTITVENKAVTCDGRDVSMSINKTNSGGSSISDVIAVGAITQEENNNVKSTTLAQIFKEHNIKNLRLLKIDCEGSEYEILKNADTELLKRIQSMRGEFHENKNLTNEYDINNLYDYVSKYINDIIVFKARGCFMM